MVDNDTTHDFSDNENSVHIASEHEMRHVKHIMLGVLCTFLLVFMLHWTSTHIKTIHISLTSPTPAEQLLLLDNLQD